MPLQTGFLAGMEWCLGVRRHVEVSKIVQRDETTNPQYDVRQADALMEAEGNDPARLRYRKMFWEAVPDGKDPVVPLLLEKARVAGIRHAQREEKSKNHSRFLPRQRGSKNMEKVKMVAATGRPMMMFVDVGGKFIDKPENLVRIKKVAHRGMLKERKRTGVLVDKERRIQEKKQLIITARAAARAERKQKKKPEWQTGAGRSLVLS